MNPDHSRCLQAHRQSPSPRHLRKHTRSQGPFLRRHYPASAVVRPCPTPANAAARSDVEAATLAPNGSPPITRTTFPTCRAHYPGGSSGCSCRLLPRITRPSPNGRRVGIRIVTFEACSGFTHVTARRIAQPPIGDLCHEAPAHAVTRISRGYRINRQLSGWILPPLMIRTFGAHCQFQTHAAQQKRFESRLALIRPSARLPHNRRPARHVGAHE